MNRTSKSGFMIGAALVLGVIVSTGAVIALLIKNSVDQNLIRDSAKYALYIAEDTIQRSVQLATKDLQSINDITTYIESLSNYTVAVAGTECPDAQNPCRFVVKETSPGVFVNYEPVGVTPPEVAVLVFTFTGNTYNQSKIKFEDFTVKITLPEPESLTPTVDQNPTLENQCLSLNNPWSTEACSKYMRGRFCLVNPTDARCRNNNPLICPPSQPIFAGTRFMNGIERANCKSFGGQYVSTTISSGVEAKCRVDRGEWLSSVNQDLSLNCSSFQNTFLNGATEQILCPDINSEQFYASQFVFSANLRAESIQCVPLGGPYDQAAHLQ